MIKINRAIKEIVQEKAPFSWEKANQSEALQEYLAFYQLDIPEIEHRSGYVSIKKESIFVQSFRPSQPKAICLVLHGYFDHTGTMSKLIHFLTKKEVHVVSYDLLGHGLSTGERASVNDFSDYLDTHRSICQSFLTEGRLPLYCVAHSTGGAVVLSCFEKNSVQFDKVILVAPLIKSHLWNLSKVGLMLIKPFVKEINRTMKNRTSNQTFNSFRREDPLQYNKTPLAWPIAMYKWFKETQNQLTSKLPLLVIQGNQDTTVGWKFNTGFIQKNYSNARIVLVDSGMHQLLNENSVILDATFTLIERYLEDKEGMSRKVVF